MEGAFHENAFIMLAHKNKEYLQQIKTEITKQEHILAVDVDNITPVYAFASCHLSLYSMRLPHLRVLYPYAVLFKSPNAATLIADIMANVADVINKIEEEGIVCVIPEDIVEALQKLEAESRPQKILDISDLLKKESIIFDQGGKDKWTILENLSHLAYDYHWISDQDLFIKSIQKREGIQSTGIGDGIALPHVRCNSVIQSFMFMMICANEVDFESIDNQGVRLIILLGFPSQSPSHLPILSKINRLLLDPSNREYLLSCKNVQEVMEFFYKAS